MSSAASGAAASHSDVKHYLKTIVFPVLHVALADMFLLQPANPFQWLGTRLLESAGSQNAIDKRFLDSSHRSSVDLLTSMHTAQSPAQLSDEAIAALSPSLPPLDSSATSTHAAEAACLQFMLADAAKDMQRAAVAMRNIWCRWHLLPVCPVMHQTAECQKSIFKAETRQEEVLLNAVYEKYKGAGAVGLSQNELLDALKDVCAPVLSTATGSSAESLFRTADIFSKGAVDFQEYTPSPHTCYHILRRVTRYFRSIR
jgi:hypothetical protein